MNKIAAILWCILSLAWTTASWAQNVAVSGKVTGANGEAIIGANVLVEGTTQGITTNVDGDYTLTNVPANATLVVSYLGYKTEKIPVGNKTRIDVTLREDTAEIEGVMVVAYGTAKKESFTGSAAVVKGGELQKRVVGNVTKSFEGTVAGVQVASGGGQPGEAASVIIRGIGSVNASATPLYVVDGIPFDGSLSAINPADIETMTVLKDASAGALYGARGANGVIVITTKKGKKDKIRISYKGNVGIASRAIPRYDLVDMKDYVEMSYEALRNSAQYGTGMDFEGASRYAAANLGQQIGGLKNPEYYNPYKNYTWETLIDQSTGKIRSDAKAAWNENWLDEISDNSAIRTEHIVSVNGGSERANYVASLGYYMEDGILQNTDFSRYTGRVGADSQAKSWLKIGMNANFAHSESSYQSFEDASTSNVWYTAQFMAPVYPVYLKDMAGNNVRDADGRLQYEYGSEDDNGYANRPSAQGFNSKAELYNNKAYYTRNSLSARSYITFGTVREEARLYGLKLTMNFGTDYTDYQRTLVYDKEHGNAAQQGGRLSKTNTRTLSYTFNQLLTYDRTFGDHSLNLLAGHEYYRYKYNYALGEKTGIVGGIDELGPAVTTTDNNSYSHNYGVESYLARINYGFKSRYYIDASWRTDGSSRFHPSDRWGHFWSVGASWRISEEQFMENTRQWLDNLTLKVSYGVQGNDNLGTYYAWQGLYDYTWPNATDAGAFVDKLENRKVTWEKNGNLNAGIEATMFGGRLGVSVEYYNRKTRDMLLDRIHGLQRQRRLAAQPGARGLAARNDPRQARLPLGRDADGFVQPQQGALAHGRPGCHHVGHPRHRGGAADLHLLPAENGRRKPRHGQAALLRLLDPDGQRRGGAGEHALRRVHHRQRGDGHLEQILPRKPRAETLRQHRFDVHDPEEHRRLVPDDLFDRRMGLRRTLQRLDVRAVRRQQLAQKRQTPLAEAGRQDRRADARSGRLVRHDQQLADRRLVLRHQEHHRRLHASQALAQEDRHRVAAHLRHAGQHRHVQPHGRHGPAV